MLFTPTPEAAQRVLEFFTTQIENDHTRRAYLHAARRFAHWCALAGICDFGSVQAYHVALFIKELQSHVSPPTVKQTLAALRKLFDWLVTGRVMDVNPAHAVRGPKYTVKKGKTPVLGAQEARDLLDSIIPPATESAVTGGMVAKPDLVGLRDRALIGVMAYTFARISAVLQMNVRDYFVQERRGWVRLHEKGGKEHEVPCHHNLERYLEAYITAAELARDPDGPLFRTAPGKFGVLTNNRMWQQDAYRMIQRRCAKVNIKTRIGNHTFRATGITAYLKNRGTLETAQILANHESSRTTKLYDRRQDEISLDEVEKISI
jgi:site-specific recombinase XerD